MKAYFITPNEKGILQNAGDRPALGVGYLATALQKFGVDARIIDLNHDRWQSMRKPDIVGFSFTTPFAKQMYDLAYAVKHTFPNALTVAGGPHVSAMPMNAYLDIFDRIVVGEGEIPILQVVTGDPNRFLFGEKIKDLDTIPKPDRSLYNMKNYGLKMDGEPATPIITSRGCPFTCVYCGKQTFGKDWRGHSADYVVDEISGIVEDFGIKNFVFYDDVFTMNKKRVKEIGEKLKRSGINIKYRATTRTNLVDESVLENLAKSGCAELCYGLESGDDNILRKAHKGMTVEGNRYAVEITKKSGIKVKGYFMIGLPGETEQTALETIKFAKSLHLDEADFYACTPFPASKLWDNPEDYGVRIYHNDRALQTGNSIMETEGLTREHVDELIKLAKEEMKK